MQPLWSLTTNAILLIRTVFMTKPKKFSPLHYITRAYLYRACHNRLINASLTLTSKREKLEPFSSLCNVYNFNKSIQTLSSTCQPESLFSPLSAIMTSFSRSFIAAWSHFHDRRGVFENHKSKTLLPRRSTFCCAKSSCLISLFFLYI